MRVRLGPLNPMAPRAGFKVQNARCVPTPILSLSALPKNGGTLVVISDRAVHARFAAGTSAIAMSADSGWGIRTTSGALGPKSSPELARRGNSVASPQSSSHQMTIEFLQPAGDTAAQPDLSWADNACRPSRQTILSRQSLRRSIYR